MRPVRIAANLPGHGRLSRGLALLGGVLAACALVLLPVRRCAAENLAAINAETAGPTPFISLVHVHMNDASLLAYVQFTITPKTGSVTRAISARYSSNYLLGRHYLNLGSGAITVPVFGLYQKYTNTVDLVFGFVDGSTQTNTLAITTAHFKGGIYNHPGVVQARRTGLPLSYDFILLKAYSSGYSPIIIDTDGEVRWVGTANTPSMEAIFYDNSFFVVGSDATTILRMELDGTVTSVANYAAQGVTSFGHNFDFGKTGILTEVNTPDYYQTVYMEVAASGAVLHTWNMASIITNAMVAGGDDPTAFVAAAGSQYDWFHNNCAVYRPSDNSLVVSSRENFVMALDYDSKAIKWILGDPTKQWYQFPSLRKYALQGAPGTDYPIGQHALSFYNDKLLLFDCGYYSADHDPKGVNRTYSAPRKYTINQAAGTATEIWDYLAGESLYSPIASSVYEDRPGNYLIDYATEGPYLDAEIIGLSASGAKMFDYKFTEINTLTTAWNATVLHLENLVFD